MGFFDSDDDDEEHYHKTKAPAHSDEFKDRHHCTNVCCCIVFAVFICAWGSLYGWALVNGETGRLYHGIDYMGRVCGVDPGVTDAPMLYWCPMTPGGAMVSSAGQLNIDGLDLANPVCTSACPVEGDNGVYTPSAVTECEQEGYTQSPYNTESVLGRYCLPNHITNEIQAQAVANSPGVKLAEFWEAMSGLENGYPIYIGVFVMAVILGYLYMACLKTCAGPMVWLAITVAIVSMLAAGTYLCITANGAGSHDIYGELGENAVWVTWVIGIIFVIIGFGLLFTMCCCAGQVKMAIMAVQMTGDVIMEMPMILLAPVAKALFKFGMWCALIYGLVKLVSTAEPTTVPGNQYNRTYELEGHQWAALVFYIFGSYWLLCFVDALYQFALAYATADYYFTHLDDFSDRDVGCCFVGEGYIVGLMYHTGSLAMGACLIALFEVVERCIEFAQKMNESGGNNPITCLIGCILCWTKCCLLCCKSCVEFMNKNAYIDMAITSLDFCAAARNAVTTIAKLSGAMAVLNGATYIFQLAGGAMITGLCGFAAYTASYNFFNDDSSEWYISNHALVTVVACIIAAGVAYSFMAVFDMVSDTLLYCMGNDGGAKAPHQLQDFVHEATQEQNSSARTYKN